MSTWTCPICNDLNPACLVMTCEDRKKIQAKRRPRRRVIKNVTPRLLSGVDAA